MEQHRNLPKKPLIEALVEIKWGAEGEMDPGFHLLVGSLYERVRSEYPDVEDLPTSNFPPALMTHVVRHRFRRTKGGWPLIQIGPGILTVNETESYTWDDFSRRSRDVLPKLFEAHPSGDKLQVSQLLLRYINGVDLDYLREDVLEFLHKNMRTDVALPASVFSDGQVDAKPMEFGLRMSFRAANPKGTLIVQINTGEIKKRSGIIWELLFRSAGTEVPGMPSELDAWLEGAHNTVERWFFELSKGPLLERFLGA
jgi:uncharacterized protein (TIGR04255 family)